MNALTTIRQLLWVSGVIASRDASTHAQSQSPLQAMPAAGAGARSVAIIGAGAAGTSTAFHLAKFAQDANVTLNVTIFERHDYIGGRSITVDVFGDPAYPVELGASIFVKVNSVLYDAVRNLGLELKGDEDDADSLGIWDGNVFVWQQQHTFYGSEWWNTLRILFKYGLQPLQTRRLVDSVIAKFLRMYQEPVFPFSSLSKAVAKLNLREETSTSGWSFLTQRGLNHAFATEIIQAATRVNYAQNLAGINGMEAMVSLAAEGAMSVRGGNWRIFDGFSRSANQVRLCTNVEEIRRTLDRWTLLTRGSDNKPVKETFDTVVLAMPFHQGGISIDGSDMIVPGVVEYVDLHVTLLSSAVPLSPSFFSLKPGEKPPATVLTTLQTGEQPGTAPGVTVGKVGFFSISKVTHVINPSTGREELVYKVFSPKALEDDFVARMFDSRPVSWRHHKLWKSYPYLRPREEFDSLALAKNLWYTGAMDTFISTMETNALMGKNIARLVLDDLSK